ncbi:MAG: response regulator [Candidatus Omnitrophica bacterium]|nr:response regulator [Candidatus Omnitrophota bacterium]
MPKRILVIDDETINQKLIKNLLKGDQFEVVTVDNGTKGVKAYFDSIGKSPFDLILLDIVMPDMSGIEVLKKIREEEKSRGIKYGYGSSIPIIMLTASKESWMDAFDGGCDDYLLKPFKNEQILNKIKEKINV